MGCSPFATALFNITDTADLQCHAHDRRAVRAPFLDDPSDPS